MVQVRGTVHDVSDNPDRVERIVVRAVEPRMHGTTYITEEPTQFPVVDGVLDFNVLPGPCVVAFLRNHGATTYEKLLVPDVAEATFKECLDAADLAEGATKATLENAVRQVQEELSKVAPLVSEVRTLHTEVSNDRTAVDGFAKAAQKSASDAATSQSKAKTSETNAANSAASAKSQQESAKTHFNNTVKEAEKAANSATAAKTSETNAASSASASASSASSSKTQAGKSAASATQAAASRDAAKASETAAAGSATAAKSSETNAAQSSSTANTHRAAAATQASAASESASQAATARDAAKQSQTAAKTSETNANKHRQAAATSESNAATHKTNAGESAAAAASSAAEAKGHADRAEVASDPEGLRNEMTKQFAALVDGAPEDLDTIREIAEYAQANRDITDQLNAAIGNKANKTHKHTTADITDATWTVGHANSGGKIVKTNQDGGIYSYYNPTVKEHLARKAYVDEQDRKIFQQDVIFEGELDQTSRIFPLRTSVNGTINIQVEWSVTQAYVDAASSSSLSLWTVKLHDKDGNVVSGSDYNDQINGMSYTGSGAPGHNYYKYSSPSPIGEVVTSSTTITVAPEFFISEVGVYNWSRPSVPGLVVRKVTISAESQTTEVMGQKVNRVEVYDNKRAIADDTSGGKLLRLNPDGQVWIGTTSVTNAHHATNKGYVDSKVSEKADKSHKHVTADITDSTDWINHPAHPNKMVRTREDGFVHGNPPTADRHVATKGYVDEEVAKKANTSHKHTTADITDFATEMGKKANTSHTHTQAQVTGLSTALNGKANKSHTHTTSQVSGLDAALDGKADKTYVNSRPALFSGSGAPPSSISGAVVGDFWLDTSTMELHKITEV